MVRRWLRSTNERASSPHDHDDLDHGASIIMINGVPHWIEPAYPHPDTRRNTAHHLPRILSA